MFKKPYEQEAFFKAPKEKPLKEEKALIQIIRQQHRHAMIVQLSAHSSGQLPDDRTVEEALDFLIDMLRNKGILKSMLDEYLQKKIAAERAQFGLAAGK